MLKNESIELIEKEIENICNLEDKLLMNGENEEFVTNICNYSKMLLRKSLENFQAGLNVDISITMKTK